MSKKLKKVIFLCCGAVIFIVILLIVAFKSNTKEDKIMSKPAQNGHSPDKPTTPLIKDGKIFSLENIPEQREDINLQLTLEQRKEGKKLSPTEEKTIIESLASQIDIDKNKSFFDYKKCGFGMTPGIWEVFSDVDETFYLSTDQGSFFVKINPYSGLSRFEYEKESMLAINEAVPDFAPYPFCLGNLPKGGKFLVVNFVESRWHDRLTVENQKSLARKLAQLHQKKSPNGKFGFHVGKNNQWKDNWEKFFLENRWQPLWKRVLEKYPQDEELKKRGTIIGEKVIPDLLGNLKAEPVLLHGALDPDSWDIGSHTNQPWVFSPYSYYGHNEIDLSLLSVIYPDLEFHESEFLAEYQKCHSLPLGFEKRKTLYQLYHTLHIFACKGYESGSRNKVLIMMKKLASKNYTTDQIKVGMEALLEGRKLVVINKKFWLCLKTKPFNYEKKTYDKIEVEVENASKMWKFMPGNEYIIEAEKIFAENDKLKITLPWYSHLTKVGKG